MEAPFNLRNVKQVLSHSLSILTANRFCLLSISLLLFSFRASLETLTLTLTSSIEHQTLTLAHPLFPAAPPFSGDSKPPESFSARRKTSSGRRRLVHFKTLDDDFFAEDLIARNPNPNFLVRISATQGLGPFMNSSGLLNGFNVNGGDGDVVAALKSGALVVFKQPETAVESGFQGEIQRFSGDGFVYDQQQVRAFFSLLTSMSILFGCLILGFFTMSSCMIGVICYMVVSVHLNRRVSITRVFRIGLQSGLQRVTGLVFFRWSVREVLTQFLFVVFFSEVKDRRVIFRLVLRLKLVPFSVISPWIDKLDWDHEVSLRILGFFGLWFLLESIISFAYTLDCWVAMLNSSKSIREAIKEGYDLMQVMVLQAFAIKCLEIVFGGFLVRQFFAKLGYDCFALYCQSLAETFFLVVWLVFFFAAKSKASQLQGQSFGENELRNYIDELR
ncbi:hypothetical protein AMTRI_Chr07g23900 [Amborella trichopoda]